VRQNKSKIRGLIFVVSGPSGSGKTTLLKNLFKDKELKKKLVKPISYTTRPKRSNERHKQDYLFITHKQFQSAQKAKKILEWTKYLGYYYGTPRDFVQWQLNKRKHLVLCLDLKGALTIKRLYPKNTVRIFINPPSLKTLQQRIGARCNKTKREEIKQRLQLAKKEILASSKFDYRIVNKNLNWAVRDLRKIILSEISIV
jgi:guanylate kinase